MGEKMKKFLIIFMSIILLLNIGIVTDTPNNTVKAEPTKSIEEGGLTKIKNTTLTDGSGQILTVKSYIHNNEKRYVVVKQPATTADRNIDTSIFILDENLNVLHKKTPYTTSYTQEFRYVGTYISTENDEIYVVQSSSDGQDPDFYVTTFSSDLSSSNTVEYTQSNERIYSGTYVNGTIYLGNGNGNLFKLDVSDNSVTSQDVVYDTRIRDLTTNPSNTYLYGGLGKTTNGKYVFKYDLESGSVVYEESDFLPDSAVGFNDDSIKINENGELLYGYWNEGSNIQKWNTNENSIGTKEGGWDVYKWGFQNLKRHIMGLNKFGEVVTSVDEYGSDVVVIDDGIYETIDTLSYSSKRSEITFGSVDGELIIAGSETIDVYITPYISSELVSDDVYYGDYSPNLEVNVTNRYSKDVNATLSINGESETYELSNGEHTISIKPTLNEGSYTLNLTTSEDHSNSWDVEVRPEPVVSLESDDVFYDLNQTHTVSIDDVVGDMNATLSIGSYSNEYDLSEGNNTVNLDTELDYGQYDLDVGLSGDYSNSYSYGISVKESPTISLDSKIAFHNTTPTLDVSVDDVEADYNATLSINNESKFYVLDTGNNTISIEPTLDKGNVYKLEAEINGTTVKSKSWDVGTEPYVDFSNVDFSLLKKYQTLKNIQTSFGMDYEYNVTSYTVEVVSNDFSEVIYEYNPSTNEFNNPNSYYLETQNETTSEYNYVYNTDVNFGWKNVNDYDEYRLVYNTTYEFNGVVGENTIYSSYFNSSDGERNYQFNIDVEDEYSLDDFGLVGIIENDVILSDYTVYFSEGSDKDGEWDSPENKVVEDVSFSYLDWVKDESFTVQDDGYLEEGNYYQVKVVSNDYSTDGETTLLTDSFYVKTDEDEFRDNFIFPPLYDGFMLLRNYIFGWLIGIFGRVGTGIMLTVSTLIGLKAGSIKFSNKEIPSNALLVLGGVLTFVFMLMELYELWFGMLLLLGIGVLTYYTKTSRTSKTNTSFDDV